MMDRAERNARRRARYAVRSRTKWAYKLRVKAWAESLFREALKLAAAKASAMKSQPRTRANG